MPRLNLFFYLALLFCGLCFVGLLGPMTIGANGEELPPTKEQPPPTEEKPPPPTQEELLLIKEKICKHVVIAKVRIVIDYATGQPIITETRVEPITPEPKDLSSLDVRAALIALAKRRPWISSPFILSFNEELQRSALQARFIIPTAFLDEVRQKQLKEKQEMPIEI